MEHKIVGSSRTPLPLWIKEFSDSLSHLSPKTKYVYQYTLFEFVLYMEKTLGNKIFSPAYVNQGMIIRWLKKTGKSNSSNTVRVKASTVSRFFSFLNKSGYLQKNPIGQLEKKYPKKGLGGIVLAFVGPSPRKSLQALKVPPRFASPLGDHMQKFIALGQAQGKIYLAEEYSLCRFDRFLRSYSPSPNQLSTSIIERWLSLFSKCSPKYQRKQFYIIRQLCLYLRRFDPTVYVPASSLCPYMPSKFQPYIYSRAEIVSLLKAAREVKPTVYSPLRANMFYMMILLLYTTGMRVSEPLKLQLRDINQKEQTLYIRKTKFFKARAVPLSPSVMEELNDYLERRRQAGVPNSPESYLFQNIYRGRPYLTATIQKLFRDIRRNLGLNTSQGYSHGPRIHDLRASFAVHRLEDWYRQGRNVQSKLGQLSTYLGHTTISGTQRYLPMTTELLSQASQRFENYFKLTKGDQKNEK